MMVSVVEKKVQNLHTSAIGGYRFKAVLHNGKDTTTKDSPKKQSIMKYSKGLHQDSKPLKGYSVYREKMLLKSHLAIKCQFQ